MEQQHRKDLLELLDDRYDSGSTIITSQLQHRDWNAVIGDPTLADATCDRLVHNARAAGAERIVDLVDFVDLVGLSAARRLPFLARGNPALLRRPRHAEDLRGPHPHRLFSYFGDVGTFTLLSKQTRAILTAAVFKFSMESSRWRGQGGRVRYR